MVRKIFWIFLPCLLFCEENPKPLALGNFSVPVVNQISPLVSFGQLIIGEDALLPQLTGAYAWGDKTYSNLILPNIIYGCRDDFSVYFALPIFPSNRNGSSHASGVGDLLVQAEYAFYTMADCDHTLQATVVGNVQFPTGSWKKNPPIGTGWFSYFLGTTLAYVSYNWYAFASPGINIPTGHHGRKFGTSFLYQCGFARYIPALSPRGWIFDLMIEFDGTYTQKNKIHGKLDDNSGGNTIFATPSIWLSSSRFLIQWGMGFPIFQNLNGKQYKIDYAINYNVGASFQF